MKRYRERPRTRQTFKLRDREDRNPTNGNERLVCHLHDNSGLLLLWATTGGNIDHIRAVERHGHPVTVSCDWIQPNEDHANKYRHRYWVDEDDYFEVVEPIIN